MAIAGDESRFGDTESSGLRYQRLSNALRASIAERDFPPGGAIPPERTLAERYDVSRVTVRRAVDELVNEGLLVRRHGAGTFVVDRVEKQFAKLSSFSEDMISRGRVPSSRWLDKTESFVTPDESLSLGLSPGSRVFRFARLRCADGFPMAIERSTIASYALTDVDAVIDSLYAALDNTGHRPVRALQKLRAILIDAESAAIMDIEPGAPGLMIERRAYLADGRIVEMTESLYRGDAYDFIAELVES
ncbi:GntR family transcriptional regulator [Sphingopyxis panaciterrae]